MRRKHHFECIECDAVFNIKYDLDEDYYHVQFCPFCGFEMDEDQQDFYEDEEE